MCAAKSTRIHITHIKASNAIMLSKLKEREKNAVFEYTEN